MALRSCIAQLTHILWGAQDLPDFRDVVHASGQAKVHDADVPQGSGTGQQDVLGLRMTETKRPLDRGHTISSNNQNHCKIVHVEKCVLILLNVIF